MDLTPDVGAPGHVFISYVREDNAAVDRLQEILEAAGVTVWRDTENLWPGQDWRLEIRRAITRESFAFLACFSDNSAARQTTYQNEELIVAVEQMRQMPPGRPWLLPIRLADCDVPEFDLGAGRTLASLQRVDLFGDLWQTGTARLVASVVRMLGQPAPALRADVVKRHDQARDCVHGRDHEDDAREPSALVPSGGQRDQDRGGDDGADRRQSRALPFEVPQPVFGGRQQLFGARVVTIRSAGDRASPEASGRAAG